MGGSRGGGWGDLLGSMAAVKRAGELLLWVAELVAVITLGVLEHIEKLTHRHR